MLFKNYPSPSPRRLKVPVNRRFAGVSRGYGGLLTFHVTFTEPSPNLHPLVVKDRWKIGESKFGMRIGWNAFVQGVCANVGEGERYFSNSSRAPVHYLCAGDRLIQLRISCSQSRDSCSCRKVVRLFQKWYGFSESPTTFSRISCSHCCLSYSRQKVLPLFRIIATSIILAAVPIARNAHYAPEHNFLSAGMFSISILIG